MDSEPTLTQVLDGLRLEGYGGSFLVDDDGRSTCCDCGATVEPAGVQLDGLRRLEGSSDPSDMAAVLAVRCGRCGSRGSVVVRYGPEAGPGDAALLIALGPHPRRGVDIAEAASAVEPGPSGPDDGARTGTPEGRWRALVAATRAVGPRLDAASGLDAVVRPVHRGLCRVVPEGRTRDALRGAWLGHPVHPALTDLPIGFWTSALVLDLVGGRRMRPAADALVALGVVSAVPTIATGLADWSALSTGKRRTGVVHGLANVVATWCYGRSFLRRRAGHRVAGIALGLSGAAAATLGGFLGGHLAFGAEGDRREGDRREGDPR